MGRGSASATKPSAPRICRDTTAQRKEDASSSTQRGKRIRAEGSPVLLFANAAAVRSSILARANCPQTRGHLLSSARMRVRISSRLIPHLTFYRFHRPTHKPVPRVAPQYSGATVLGRASTVRRPSAVRPPRTVWRPSPEASVKSARRAPNEAFVVRILNPFRRPHIRGSPPPENTVQK